MAMPILSATPGEKRKSALRNARPPLTLGRPVTDTTVKLRQRYWDIFLTWTRENALDFEVMLEHSYSCIDEINIVMTRYGRLLYQKGKSYNQYAETLNALGSHRPSLRRLLQQSWDLGYAWVKSEPSTHHVAMPARVVISMISIAILWGWPFVAGVLALGFGAMLRPGEVCSALRKDLLLPRDVDHTVDYGLLSIREPKSRFTHARHQSAKIDSPDLMAVIDMAFGQLPGGERLWPYSSQTLRSRFRSLLAALKLPVSSTPHLRALDLGSLRSGGATYVIQVTEDSELCRRRGRWASMKMMDIYVQEVMALQYMKMISDDSRKHVLKVASFFAPLLAQAKLFRSSGIPEKVWCLLLSK